MQFSFTDEQTLIADSVRRFFLDNATSARTRDAMADQGMDGALWQAFVDELGLAGVLIPEAHRGAGLGMVELAIIAEAAGAQVAALPLLGLVQASQALLAGGSAAQQAHWLPRLADGRTLAACAETSAIEASGNRLSGSCDFLPHGTVANLFVVAADNGLWLVEADAPGMTVTPLTTMDQTRPFARLTLTQTPAEPLADGERARAAATAGGLVCLAAEALGGAQSCLDRTVSYALDRVQFGRPIGSFQAYKHRLADMMVDIEQARSAVYWAACAIDEGAAEATLALHAAKAFAADTYFRCAGDMIQLHGGIGFTWEHDAHLFLKRAKAIQHMLGSSDWHREQIARLIGLGETA